MWPLYRLEPIYSLPQSSVLSTDPSTEWLLFPSLSNFGETEAACVLSERWPHASPSTSVSPELTHQVTPHPFHLFQEESAGFFYPQLEEVNPTEPGGGGGLAVRVFPHSLHTLCAIQASPNCLQVAGKAGFNFSVTPGQLREGASWNRRGHWTWKPALMPTSSSGAGALADVDDRHSVGLVRVRQGAIGSQPWGEIVPLNKAGTLAAKGST